MTNVQEQEKPRAKVWVDFSNLTTQFGSLAGAEIEKFTELHNKDAHRMNRHAQLLEEENARLRAAVDLRNKLDEERGAAVLEASRLKQEVADLKRMNADIADVIRGRLKAREELPEDVEGLQDRVQILVEEVAKLTDSNDKKVEAIHRLVRQKGVAELRCKRREDLIRRVIRELCDICGVTYDDTSKFQEACLRDNDDVLEPIYAKLNTYLQGYVFAMSLKELNETILSKISKIDRIAVTFKED